VPATFLDWREHPQVSQLTGGFLENSFLIIRVKKINCYRQMNNYYKKNTQR